MPITFPVSTRTLVIHHGSNIHVYYPQVNRMKDTTLANHIKQLIIKDTQTLINLQVGNMPSTLEEMLGSYALKNNQRKVFSLTLTNYTYHEKAAHGMTFIKALTFDLTKEKKVNLADLFKPRSDYKQRLSKLVEEQIIARDVPLLGAFTGIKPDQDFYIADKTLVLFYQLYDITPYVYGFPMFPINIYDIQDIINKDGPLERLVENN
ncbi:RsiV family protein [Oceanobacillus piezotolerans]|uniref:RsiV family protein n=1 Tax=Oceanobacillus piezotolerans TaxID=2448030 RepID=UPI001FEC809E|nr:RsiV family protein [Oceanobacillus piezotolerans]